MITADQIRFCEHYQQYGRRVDAVLEAYPALRDKPVESLQLHAKTLLNMADVQEYLAFLAQEGRGRAALPLSEFLFNMEAMKEENSELMRTSVRSREFNAAAAFSRLAFQCEEAKGRASGLFNDRTAPQGNASADEPLNVNVRWAA